MIKRQNVLFPIVLLFFSQALFANVIAQEMSYYPSDFYEAVERRAPDLKNRLHDVLALAHQSGDGNDTLTKNCSDENCYRHTNIGYKSARVALFGDIALERVGNGYGVFDVYCETMKTNGNVSKLGIGPGQIPDDKVMNAEHTWPQSRFSGRFEKGMQKADLHNLYPVDSQANSTRGSFEFADVTTEKNAPCDPARLGYNSRGGGTHFFEVPPAHKGNVARALFYFAVRYQLRINEIEEDSLRAWHRADPVDEAERARSQKVFDKQKVRNPFIDHPELVELIADF